jgi:hypothetical protein
VGFVEVRLREIGVNAGFGGCFCSDGRGKVAGSGGRGNCPNKIGFGSIAKNSFLFEYERIISLVMSPLEWNVAIAE